MVYLYSLFFLIASNFPMEFSSNKIKNNKKFVDVVHNFSASLPGYNLPSKYFEKKITRKISMPVNKSNFAREVVEVFYHELGHAFYQAEWSIDIFVPQQFEEIGSFGNREWRVTGRAYGAQNDTNLKKNKDVAIGGLLGGLIFDKNFIAGSKSNMMSLEGCIEAVKDRYLKESTHPYEKTIKSLKDAEYNSEEDLVEECLPFKDSPEDFFKYLTLSNIFKREKIVASLQDSCKSLYNQIEQRFGKNDFLLFHFINGLCELYTQKISNDEDDLYVRINSNEAWQKYYEMLNDYLLSSMSLFKEQDFFHSTLFSFNRDILLQGMRDPEINKFLRNYCTQILKAKEKQSSDVIHSFKKIDWKECELSIKESEISDSLNGAIIFFEKKTSEVLSETYFSSLITLLNEFLSTKNTVTIDEINSLLEKMNKAVYASFLQDFAALNKSSSNKEFARVLVSASLINLLIFDFCEFLAKQVMAFKFYSEATKNDVSALALEDTYNALSKHYKEASLLE